MPRRGPDDGHVLQRLPPVRGEMRGHEAGFGDGVVGEEEHERRGGGGDAQIPGDGDSLGR